MRGDDTGSLNRNRGCGTVRAMKATDESWMRYGACRDVPPDVFFPNDGVGVTAAQQICSGCSVREACLEYALTNRIDHGVWGGASERARRTMLKQRRRGVAQIPAIATDRCSRCGIDFERDPGRGRPPARCPTCRAA